MLNGKIPGYSFKNPEFLKSALIHSSFANEKNTTSNERIEFLGDSVLSLIISEYLYKNYGKLPEGELSKTRARIVCEQSLAICARNMELGQHIKMGKGEEAAGGQNRDSILADAFEAILGAVFLDSDFDTVRNWALTVLRDNIDSALKGGIFKDYKTLLQESCQKNGIHTINYVIDFEKGPDHNKTFGVSVFIDNRPVGGGVGRSKKDAEQDAARAALSQLKKR